ncbi:MAG: F0F1 ATP synthase subunit A [Candidatus Pacebacteria bacterium]|nr:F0F1 ATP synthase subunit A [Candidatus Paceibacterota bacterium]
MGTIHINGECAAALGPPLLCATISKNMQSGIHISLAAERVGSLFGIPVTNTLITSWIVMTVLILTAFFVGRRISMVPSRFQTFLEWLVEYVYDFITETLEDRTWARRMFPLLMTIFLFIATSNLLEFTPGVGSIIIKQGAEWVPLLRSVNSDLNTTLALAIISVFSIEIAGIVAVGLFRYGGKFINFSSPLNFIVGLIELISELSRFVSFSFRLFGNVFAGEVLLAVAGYFVPYILPVPLMSFELFVGIVQAAVFALLTLFFVKLAIMEPHGEEAH